jgi:alkyl hydroperoxide reductase subunit AhpF
VAYCATCDAPLFAGKDVAVIGGGNSALTAVNDLLKVVNQVKLVSILLNLQGDAVLIEKARDPRVEILLGWETTAIKGQTQVESVQIVSKDKKEPRELKVQGVFIEIGLEPNSEFAKGVLALNERGEIIVDCSCRTSVIGIFAAGDVTNVQEKQIIVAAGDGAKASLAAYSYIQSRGE